MTDQITIKVPDIGDFKDVEIIDVLVAEGESVDAEQGLITIETDKAAMDVPSTHAGVIKSLKVKVGDKVSEGSEIAVIEASGDAKSSQDSKPVGAAEPDRDGREASEPEAPQDERKRDKPAERKPAPRQDGDSAAALSTSGGTPPHASPSVRKFARELGVDLAQVKGSGRKNRILHDDVKAHVKSVMQGGGAQGGFSLPQMPQVDFSKWGEVETKPLTRIQRIAGPHLQRAWVTIPHVTQHDEADITDLETMRKAMKGDAEKVGAKLTPLAFILKACVHALKEFPDFNASLDGENLIVKRYYHIGFAVDTPEGLVVPVVRDADTKSVFEIAKALGDISAKARDKKLKAADIQGGTFSISSLGGIGGSAFTPIINAPEVAILGVSRSQMKPAWDGDEFQPRLMLPLSLSYDHRVIDGAAAARFTTRLAEILHNVEDLVL